MSVFVLSFCGFLTMNLWIVFYFTGNKFHFAYKRCLIQRDVKTQSSAFFFLDKNDLYRLSPFLTFIHSKTMNNSDLIDKIILILKEAFENRQLLLA